jgi:hypothetical protein
MHGLGIRDYTEGVQYMAEQGGAYWLLKRSRAWQSDSQGVKEDQNAPAHSVLCARHSS